jgi:hypothetical protein
LGQAGQAAGGKQNLALGGLGALAGALLGRGGKSLGGALGGGVMALLGAMAFKALQGSGQSAGRVPLGLMEPQSEGEREELENRSELVLKAMINAAKADGKIDEGEAHRIVGKVLLITSLVRRGFEVLFRPIEAGLGGYLSKGFEGLGGILSRRTDQWVMEDRESQAIPSRSNLV